KEVMGNSFGRVFRISTFGESHGKGLGVIIDGCPAGLPIDEAFIQQELQRRKPGQSKITTQRKEEDECQILSGVFEGKSTGTPIALVILNTDQKSKDYSTFPTNSDLPTPIIPISKNTASVITVEEAEVAPEKLQPG